ncbi:MAG TPA: helix-turn-helix transcriptional regulator [Thermoguttaceae bacterium]|nr:helix-turn-helix transcriptional regulator [Thermoguttaceae bacterium]
MPIIGSMGKKRKQKPTLSDQIRRLIESSGMSRYEIARQTGIEQSVLSRFMSGERGLTTLTLDRLGELFDLEVVHRGRKRS